MTFKGGANVVWVRVPPPAPNAVLANFYEGFSRF